jgi:hypothetical protein
MYAFRTRRLEKTRRYRNKPKNHRGTNQEIRTHHPKTMPFKTMLARMGVTPAMAQLAVAAESPTAERMARHHHAAQNQEQ